VNTIMHIVQATGGVERYLYTLLSNSDKTEYRNILVCSQEYDYENFKNLAEQVEFVEMYRKINLLNDLKAITQVRNIIKKYKPDIVYMHSSKAGAIGRIANLGITNISVYNAHGWAFNMRCSNKKKIIYTTIEKMLAPLCTKIIAISDFEKRSAVERGVCKPEKIEVILNGINIKEYENVTPVRRIDLGIPEDAFIVGTVGRLTEQKAPDIFVKAAKKIKEKIPNSYFVMVGDGDQQEVIEKLIKNQELQDCFVITGWVKNPIDYISCFDIATLLSRWEGFGLVLAEYMITGKPIVATRADAIPDIITDGENGLMANVDDIDGVYRAVVKIHDDKALAGRLVQNKLSCAKDRFNFERVVKETEQLFRQALKV